ncbi:MAG TPA: TRAM domain-containing protein [Gemmatimonadales bacterium]|nr:TRAM domain-containing protein [Gemmatimonadales bacterium]
MTDPSASPVSITGIASGGDGVGRLADGRTVFVPRTAPGDVVEPGQVRLFRTYARARVSRLITPGPDRIEPRCPHYLADECGGCQLQHLALPAQLEAKRRTVGDAFRRIARVEVDDPAIVPSDAAWEYRTKLTLAVAGRGRVIGLHRYERAAEVFELEYCHIAAPALNALWRGVKRSRRLLPPDAERLVLRLDRGGGLHLNVVARGSAVWRGAARLHEALGADGVEAAVWWQPEGGAARVVAGGGAEGAYPATVFEQIHPALGDRIREHALDQLGPVGGRHVWDLYAGIGETTERLARAGASVESVESDPRAVELARARTAGLGAVRLHAARVEEMLAGLGRPELVVTNPPRVGMDPRVPETIARLRPARVVYISCDPATLARDVGRLLPAYRVGSLLAFDLFPQTAHVETVATLEAR